MDYSYIPKEWRALPIKTEVYRRELSSSEKRALDNNIVPRMQRKGYILCENYIAGEMYLKGPAVVNLKEKLVVVWSVPIRCSRSRHTDKREYRLHSIGVRTKQRRCRYVKCS